MKDIEQGTENYVWNKKDFIGEGSFAVVFKGRHRKTQVKVAVKVCAVKKCTGNDGRRYIEDIRLFEKFDSPYITKYFADEQVKGTIKNKSAIVMELADGSLRNELFKEQNRFGLPKQMFLTLVHDCVLALEYLDDHTLSHRDIKPDNILIFFQPRLTFKLSDFGTALQLGDSNQSMHTYLGARAYMPTSMIKQKASDSDISYTKDEYDIWATSCSLFEGATGRIPFKPREGCANDGKFEKEMSEVFLNRPNDIVCAQFDEQQGKYVYEKDLPKQHDSYSREFRNILSRYFQLIFNKGKKFLNIRSFSALSQEMTSIREHRYYCLNTLTVETYCDTERCEFFPYTTLLSAVQNAIRSSAGNPTGLLLPPECQTIINAFIRETSESRDNHLIYKEPFLAATMPWNVFENGLPSGVAAWYETSDSVTMEIQSNDGISVKNKKPCTFQELATGSIKSSLCDYLSLCKTDPPEDPLPYSSEQTDRSGRSGVNSNLGMPFESDNGEPSSPNASCEAMGTAPAAPWDATAPAAPWDATAPQSWTEHQNTVQEPKKKSSKPAWKREVSRFGRHLRKGKF